MCCHYLGSASDRRFRGIRVKVAGETGDGELGTKVEWPPPEILPGVSARLNELLIAAALDPLGTSLALQFEAFYKLLVRWNARTNLTAIRDEADILSRHFVESIAAASALPSGIRTLLDFGSGAGFPGIPIALCRPEITVTLAESQGKKAAFLQEAIRTLQLNSKVFPQRAQLISTRFDCVALRAVDRMRDAIGSASRLLLPGGRLAIFTTPRELSGVRAVLGSDVVSWADVRIGGSDRMIALVTIRPATAS